MTASVTGLRETETARVVAVALVVATLLVAYQLAAKSIRDALLLANERLGIAHLPDMMIVSALVSIAAVLLLSPLLIRLGPARFVQQAFVASALLFGVEWALWAKSPVAATIALYLHIGALGPLLFSGFWSALGERLDPRTGRRALARVAGFSSLGALLGFGLGDWTSHLSSPVAALLPLASLNLLCAGALFFLPAPVRQRAAVGSDTRSGEGGSRIEGGIEGAPGPGFEAGTEGAAFGSGLRSFVAGFRVLSEARYLRDLAILVLLTAASAQFLDFAFKAAATLAVSPGAAAGPAGAGLAGAGTSHAALSMVAQQQLQRLFLRFNVGVYLLAFLVQFPLARWRVDAAGPARKVLVLPLAVMVAGGGALLLPGFRTLLWARGVELLVLSSLFRSGYEHLFSPVPVHEKRPAKSLIDVGFGRAGDALGGLVAKSMLNWSAVLFPLTLAAGGAAHEARPFLVAAILAAAVGALVALRLHRGYRGALEKDLHRRADWSEPEIPGGSLPAHALAGADSMNLSQSFELPVLLAPGDEAGPAPTPGPAPSPHPTPGPAPGAPLPLHSQPSRGTEPGPAPPAPEGEAHALPADPLMRDILDLRSNEVWRIERVLDPNVRLDPRLAVHVIPLLANDSVARRAMLSLRTIAGEITGQLGDRLVDPEEKEVIRRRLPRVLFVASGPRVVDALMGGLSDKRFDVRYHCGRALARMKDREPGLAVDRERTFATVLREVSVERGVWEVRRDLVRLDERDETPIFDAVLIDRADRSLEHVFTLLSLVLQRETLQIAFRGLHTKDAQLRGVALEYLESELPDPIREHLWPFLEEPPGRRRTERPRAEIEASLLQSHESIVFHLRDLEEKMRRGGTPRETDSRDPASGEAQGGDPATGDVPGGGEVR